MLTEFDQNTIAYMTAALDYVCKKIPADKDDGEMRKRISARHARQGAPGRSSVKSEP